MDKSSLLKKLQNKIDNLNKPKGSLGFLEDLAIKIGLIQNSLSPKLTHPCHILLASDHGIEKEGVSPSPREVTYQQMVNFTFGGGAVNVLCSQHNIDLKLVDVGVDYNLEDYPKILNRKISPRGTKNFLFSPAMDFKQLQSCFKVAKELIEDCSRKGCNIISVGEMAVGNTSSSSLWMHLLLGAPLNDCVGIGSGLNPKGLSHKLSVLKKSLERSHPSSPKEIMMEFGGFEMVTTVGLFLEAKKRGMVILIDGFIMSACALMAQRIDESFLDNAIFSHLGAEKGHKLMLESLNVRPILKLGMHLGEGTGALCAYPIVESAVELLSKMNSFSSSNVTKYF